MFYKCNRIFSLLAFLLSAYATMHLWIVRTKEREFVSVRNERVFQMESILDRESSAFSSAMKYLDMDGDLEVFYTDIANITIDDLVFVTAFTSQFLQKAKHSCASFFQSEQFKSYKNLKLIAFDLGGSSENQLKSYSESCPIAEIRKFPYEQFPKYVKTATEYRFKALAIALALKEFKAAFWMDTSIVFNNIGHGTVASHFDEMKRKRQSAMLFFFSSHSIAAATHPKMYRYFPIDEEKAVERDMYDANSQLWFGTKEAKKGPLKRYVQCSLISECMAPEGATTRCIFDAKRRHYANCHRFDQSAINLALNIYSNDNISSYTRDNAQWVPQRM